MSIIVPVYNCERYLRTCFESLINQCFKEYEIIVVNDGSTDDSYKIIDEYKSKYPELFHVIHKENEGVSKARNIGLEYARGKYISFVDSDDYISSEMIEKMYVGIEESDLTICTRYDFEGEQLKYIPLNDGLENQESYLVNDIKDTGKLMVLLTPFVWDKIFKTDIIRNRKIRFSENISYAEDLEFLLKYLYYVSSVRIVNEGLYYYNGVRTGSATNRFSKHWFDMYQALEQVNLFYTEKNVYEEVEIYLCRVAVGLFCRRVSSLHLYKNKNLQMKFINEYTGMLEKYYKDWCYIFCKQLNIINMKTEVILLQLKIYVLIPNFLKRFVLGARRIKKKLKI